MSTRENKELVARLLAAHERHDVAAVEKILSPRLEWHHPGSDEPMDRQDYLAGIEMGRGAFSEIKIITEDMLAENDRVAARVTNRMLHDGEFMGVPPSGRTVTFSATWFYRIAAGEIEEIWHLSEDVLAKLKEASAG